jgi:hypothetical protein
VYLGVWEEVYLGGDVLGGDVFGKGGIKLKECNRGSAVGVSEEILALGRSALGNGT